MAAILGVGLLALVSCQQPGVGPSSLVEESRNSSIWRFHAQCNKQHDGIYNWESNRTPDRNIAQQWADDHNNDWGHDAKVRRSKMR